MSKNNPRLFFFILFIHNDVGFKRYFDPFDIRLLRALHSSNSLKNCILNKRIKNGNTVKRDVTICNKYDEKTMHIKNGVELCNTK